MMLTVKGRVPTKKEKKKCSKLDLKTKKKKKARTMFNVHRYHLKKLIRNLVSHFFIFLFLYSFFLVIIFWKPALRHICFISETTDGLSSAP